MKGRGQRWEGRWGMNWKSWWIKMAWPLHLLFSLWVMSNSLRIHGLQHIRLLCPSLSLRVCSSSCLLSQWCYLVISSSAAPFPPGLNLSQDQRLFQWVGSSHQVAKVLELQLQQQSFQWIFRVDFLSDSLVWSPCSPRYFQESSPAPQFKALILQCSAIFTAQVSHLYLTIGKTIALTIRTVMSNSKDFSVPVPPASHSLS